MPSATIDLPRVLGELGAVAGGGTALGAAIGFVAGALARDLRLRSQAQPLRWAEYGGAYGGLFSLCLLGYRALGV